MKPFEVGKTYKTCGGLSVRIVAVDAKGRYPICGLLLKDGDESAETWTSDGIYLDTASDGLNLIPEKETRTVWMNVYPVGQCCYGYDSVDTANERASNFERIACIPVTFEVP